MLPKFFIHKTYVAINHITIYCTSVVKIYLTYFQELVRLFTNIKYICNDSKRNILMMTASITLNSDNDLAVLSDVVRKCDYRFLFYIDVSEILFHWLNIQVSVKSNHRNIFGISVVYNLKSLHYVLCLN